MIPTYRPCIGREELNAVQSVFDSRWLGMGQVTHRFERRLEEFLGARRVVAVDRGTAALHLALDALELRAGDEVIVPSLTFVGTIQAIRMTGATPVFCEVEQRTLNTDVPDALGRITDKTRVILPVHFGGLPCEMDKLLQAARMRGIRVVEDAAHAFGSSYNGRMIGTLSDLTCFSFDAIKNITCGEGGAVATDSDELANRIARRRCLGIERAVDGTDPAHATWQYRVLSHGFRYHMSDINAAIGLAQLEKFPVFQKRRREIVRRYDEAFAKIEGIEPLRHDLEQTCPWAYVVKVHGDRRDEFRAHLARHGIATLIQFIPNHLQPAFAQFRVPLPVTEQLFRQIVSLPLHVELTDENIETVIRAVYRFFDAPGRTRRRRSCPQKAEP